MKSGKNIFIVAIIAVVCGFSQMMHALSDDAVVDSIKAHSNLTQSDVDRWKFLWMGGAENIAAALATGYAAKRAGFAAYEAAGKHADLIKNVFAGQWMPQFLKSYEPSENVQGWMTGKWVWAGVGVTGVGIAAYNVLYPRIQMGIIDKIEKYVKLCDSLAVSRDFYPSQDGFDNALQYPGNTVWLVSSAIAQADGFNNLINQGNVALLLIDQLLGSGIAGDEKKRIEDLRRRIVNIGKNLNHNYQFIAAQVKQEEQQRAQRRVEYGKELDIHGKEVGIAGRRMKTLRAQWELLKDIGKTVKEYGPPAIAALGAWTVYDTGRNWLYPQTAPAQ